MLSKKLSSASGALQSIPQRNPEYAPAYVEAARAVLNGSYTRTMGADEMFQVGVARAERLLDRALELDPSFAEAPALNAHVLAHKGQAGLAEIAVQKTRISPDGSGR